MAILGTGLLLACLILPLSSATSLEDTECKQTYYVEIGTRGLIPCSCNGSYLELIAWVNVNEGKTLLLRHGDVKRGDGYQSGEYDIYPNGSLVINNVTASHESVYRVSTAISTSGSSISKNICVHTTVKPAITIPVIEECSNTYGTTCVKSTTDSVEVNCFVRDSRPAVKLSWSLRTLGGDHILPSNYMKFTIDNVTYTSHATATFSFGESSVLSLLVCRASSVPLNLVEDENVLLIEKEIYYTSMATPIKIYLKIHSPMNLSCADIGLNVVIWKWSPERDAFETLYVSIFQNSNHTKISNREYRLKDEGSLSLQNTLVEHEGLYACVHDNSVGSGIVLYDVIVMVDPTPVFPVIDGCNHQQYCVLEKQHQDVLTCSVLGIRPKVALQWRAFREETAIDFTQRQLTVTQMGDLYDISLKVNFDFTQTTQNRVTVECRAVGENAELFSLSTKVDLLFPNVLPTEQGSHTSTITIIAVVVIMMIIIIGAAVVIIFRIRARKLKMKRNKPGDTENEGIPMMENTNGKAERFIEHLKAKYEIFYDSVQPIPYIKDRMYCVDKVFVEGGIEYMTGISGGQAQWDKLSSYQEVVKGNCLKTKRQILEGEPGYGKSTLTLQLLYDWCKSLSKSPLRGVDVIVYLRLRQLGGVKSILCAIRRFILPRDSDISEEDVKEILNQMNSVLVLLDGFDEYPDQESTETDIYHIMKKNMLQGFNVILTTRPSCVPKDFAPHSDRVRLTGFGEEARRKYVEKAVVGKCGEAVNRIMRKLEENPVLNDLCQVPLFFVTFAHMTYEDEHSLTFNSVTSFFRYMISCFHSHMKNKMKDENVTNFELLENEHKVLDKIAFEALSGKTQKLVWNREQLLNQLGNEFYDQYLRIGIFVEEEVLNIADTSKAQNHIQYNTEVHFYHKIFCEWYAAHYVAEQLSGGNTDCIDEFLQTLDPFNLQYLYRFACGINKITGEKIIKYLQKKKESTKFAILCILEQEDKTDRFLKSVADLVSSEETYIMREDSKLLQRSTLQILDVASKNEIPISCVWLGDCSPRVDESGLNLILQSGLSLYTLSSLQKLVIHDTDRRLTNEELAAILSYSSQCTSLKELVFGEYDLPDTIPVGSIPSSLKSRNVKVLNLSLTSSSRRLNLQTGPWQTCDGDGNLPGEEGFDEESYQRSLARIKSIMAQAEPSQCTGRDTGTNLAERFGRFKNDLADHLDLPVIHKLSNLLGLQRGEIDIIERYRTPGYMMVNRLESQGVIAPTSITYLVNMLHQLNLAGLAESIQKSFQATKGQSTPLEEKKNNLVKYAKIAYQKQYGTARPFPSMSKCSINSFFVEGGIYYLAQEGDSMQKPDVLESLESYNEILNSPKTKSKRKIVEGEPGYGKSTYALQFLYDWCTKNPTSPLKDVDILIYLQLGQLAGVKSIYTAIKRFIVPKDEDMDEACIEEILKVYKKSAVILFDSYDEYPDKNDTETDISSIILMKMFQEMVVMILTRKLNLPSGLHPDTKRIRLTGFGAAERRKYILKVMDNDVQLANRIEKQLQGNPLLKDLCQVPIFFTMVAHIVHKSPEIEIFSSLTTFFKYLIKCFHNHLKSKKSDNTEAPAFERELAELYRIAFDGLTQKKQQLAWKKTYLVSELGHKFYDYYIDLGILVQDEVFRIVQYRYEIEARIFHKIICEFYASHHLVRILSEGTSSAASSINVKETLNSINPLDLQYVYRFACGLNKSAADIIIKHLSETEEGRQLAILCMHEQEEQSEQCLQSVKDLVLSSISIASHHANSLQRSTIQVLEVASANQFPIPSAGLFECSPRVDESGLNLILRSGLSFSILSSLQKLVIHDFDRRLTNEEWAAILSYSSQCKCLKLLMFVQYDLPNNIPVGSIPFSLRAANVKVCIMRYLFCCRLDLQTGVWQACDLTGRLPGEEEFDEERYYKRLAEFNLRQNLA